MKQYSKAEMISLFVANKMQIQVTNAYNLQHYGIAVTVEETAHFAEHSSMRNWTAKQLESRFCLVVWKLESGEPFAITPVDITLVADEVYKALNG